MTVGVISKIHQASSEPKILAAVQALLLNQGPRSTSDIPWVALIGQSVSIASTQAGGVGADNSLETAWRAESESLKSILTGAPQSKLGRIALVETLAQQVRNRMKVRLPNLLSGLQGKSQIVQDELFRLGEQMVHSSEGTRALALELCREFEDKFLQHITTGEGSGWKVVASFEGNFPNRIKQLPLDRHFDINNVKRHRSGKHFSMDEMNLSYDQWVAPTISGTQPRARYEHGAAVIHDKMYIFGGNHNGRYLNDLQVLDMRSWSWSKVEVQVGEGGSKTPCAGHTLIPWEGNKLLSVAGQTKGPSETLQAYRAQKRNWMRSWIRSGARNMATNWERNGARNRATNWERNGARNRATNWERNGARNRATNWERNGERNGERNWATKCFLSPFLAPFVANWGEEICLKGRRNGGARRFGERNFFPLPCRRPTLFSSPGSSPHSSPHDSFSCSVY